jgi:hypothetical protein
MVGVMFRLSVHPHLYLGNHLINFSIILQKGSLGEYMLKNFPLFDRIVLGFLAIFGGFSNVKEWEFLTWG